MNRQKNKRKQNANTRQANNGQRRQMGNGEPIAGGVFERLKMEPLMEVTQIKLHKFWPPVTVPVTFSGLPRYIEKIWDTTQTSIMHHFKDNHSEYNKAVFIKGALMLAEAKVYCAQRYRYVPKQYRKYSSEELERLKYTANRLPFLLALYLKCLGKTNDCSQEVTPVLAEHADNAKWSAALSWAPKQLPPLLELLRKGVSVDSPDYAAGCWLHGLPKIEWEECRGPPAPPALEGAPCVRLTEHSFKFWTTNVGTAEEPRYDLKWRNEDQDLFQEVVNAMRSHTNSFVPIDLFEAKGSRAQFVQTSEWHDNGSGNWFVNTNLDDYSIKLGVAFGFGNNARAVSKSRFTGSPKNAHMRGELSPSQIIDRILFDYLSLRYTSEEVNGQKRLEAVSIVQISKIPPPVTVPVTLSALPSYIDHIWSQMKTMGARGFSLIDYDDDKAVFKKGALMLAEAKVYYAQRSSCLSPDEFLTSRRYSYEELENLKSLCYKLPLPLALYLECLGNTTDGSQLVTPILVDAPHHEWTNKDEENRFEQIIYKFGFETPSVHVDLTHGNGSQAQFVQTPKWKFNKSIDWFVNTTNYVDDYSIKLGVAFGFGSTTRNANKSRFTGSFESAHMTGDQSPSKIITKILSEWSKHIAYDTDSSDN